MQIFWGTTQTCAEPQNHSNLWRIFEKCKVQQRTCRGNPANSFRKFVLEFLKCTSPSAMNLLDPEPSQALPPLGIQGNCEALLALYR